MVGESEPISLILASAETGAEWTVSVRNKRVLRDWRDLADRAPENTELCLQKLSSQPMVRVPRRVFPLKHAKYRGVWEYEVTGGDRVFYIPKEGERTVLVYYAGKHLTPAPVPPG